MSGFERVLTVASCYISWMLGVSTCPLYVLNRVHLPFHVFHKQAYGSEETSLWRFQVLLKYPTEVNETTSLIRSTYLRLDPAFPKTTLRTTAGPWRLPTQACWMATWPECRQAQALRSRLLLRLSVPERQKQPRNLTF